MLSWLLTSLGMVNNWWQIAAGGSYFEQFYVQSPFTHLYKFCSVTEPIYVIWPLLVLLLLALFMMLLPILTPAVGFPCALAALMAGYRASRTGCLADYYGTDTRLFAFMVGSSLAVVLPVEELRKLRSERAGCWPSPSCSVTPFSESCSAPCRIAGPLHLSRGHVHQQPHYRPCGCCNGASGDGSGQDFAVQTDPVDRQAQFPCSISGIALSFRFIKLKWWIRAICLSVIFCSRQGSSLCSPSWDTNYSKRTLVRCRFCILGAFVENIAGMKANRSRGSTRHSAGKIASLISLEHACGCIGALYKGSGENAEVQELRIRLQKARKNGRNQSGRYRLQPASTTSKA